MKGLKRGAAAVAMGIIGAASGCARLPPGAATLSGKRLIVTLTYSGFINPNEHYFFILNNAGDQNAPGPVAVFLPPYGNGFATGSGANAGGFTDFVRFDNFQPGNNGYSLYHVVGDPNRSGFVNEGSPVTSTRPDPTDPRSGKQLQFQIDLSQLEVDSNGTPLPADQAVANAQSIRFLQMNIISTDVIPADVGTPVNKQVDSLGDTRTATGQSTFVVLDVSQNRVYRNTDFIGQPAFEPSDNDVFGSANPDPSLDLIDWTVEVRQQ
ncbi:MAG TPA: hypothetical protein VKT77_20125 [Chthonomonadaceae bacterium]|nr:hypothetical protein [Chthonomonadaceae bacterium]